MELDLNFHDISFILQNLSRHELIQIIFDKFNCKYWSVSRDILDMTCFTFICLIASAFGILSISCHFSYSRNFNLVMKTPEVIEDFQWNLIILILSLYAKIGFRKPEVQMNNSWVTHDGSVTLEMILKTES